MKDTQSRSFYITCLNVVAMWAVVCLHTNGVFWQFSAQRYWFTANILESLFYVAVPIFFMITGATLVDYQDRYSTKEFFVRRAKKTVIPFLAWSLIGYALQLYRGETSPSLKGLVNGVLGTSIVGIYWFFPVLFCVYLTLPLFAAVAREKRKSVFTYLAVAGFVVNSLVPFILKVFSIDLRWPFSLNSVTDIYIYMRWVSSQPLSSIFQMGRSALHHRRAGAFPPHGGDLRAVCTRGRYRHDLQGIRKCPLCAIRHRRFSLFQAACPWDLAYGQAHCLFKRVYLWRLSAPCLCDECRAKVCVRRAGHSRRVHRLPAGRPHPHHPRVRVDHLSHPKGSGPPGHRSLKEGRTIYTRRHRRKGG